MDIQRTGVSTPGGLHVVLSETQGANVTRHVHSLRGIHAHKDATNNWEWPLQDGLGSVRGVVDNSLAVLESRNYDPFGSGFGNTGTSQTNYGFTGELVDGGGLLDLRARRYAPGLGVFASLDPLETPNRYAYVSGNPINDTVGELIFHNRYSYANGNPTNLVDPNGMQACTPGSICIAPIDEIPFTSNCALFPNALGCPGNVPITIIPPNFDPNNSLEIARWCNNGFCPSGLGNVFIIPNVEVPPEVIEDYRRQCKQGNNLACIALVNALSGRCRFHNDDDACYEILELCNRGVTAACDPEVRRRCTDIRAKELRDAKNSACQNYSCDSNDSCEDLAKKIVQAWLCRQARQDIINECYQGRGDAIHDEDTGEISILQDIVIPRCRNLFNYNPKQGRFAPCDRNLVPQEYRWLLSSSTIIA
ncbi:MAG: RHS repeat-associated core domain-containing protein [Anaerolineae bacterium]